MGLLDLYMVASVPVMKVLLICGLGSFLALDHIDILGESARKQINNVSINFSFIILLEQSSVTFSNLTELFNLCNQVVFFVFNPALVSSNLAQTITLENIVSL